MVLEDAPRLISLGFGGVLCLSAVALRAGFSGEELGTAFGFLYQILTVTFLAFNWAAQPDHGLQAGFKGLLDPRILWKLMWNASF